MSNHEEVVERLTRIETKLDMVCEDVIPQVKANTKFRHIVTGIGAFLVALGSAVGGFVAFWR
jgi:uncharacterized protein YfkK (UPF0435 family)